MSWFFLACCVVFAGIFLYQHSMKPKNRNERLGLEVENPNAVMEAMEKSPGLIVTRASDALAPGISTQLSDDISAFFERYESVSETNGSTVIARSFLLENESYETPFTIGRQDYFDIVVLGREGKIKIAQGAGAHLDAVGTYDDIWSMLQSELLA